MHLEVVTPKGSKVKEPKVTQVTAPGTLGELGILPGHRPLITSLSVGRLSFSTGPAAGETRHLCVNGGYLEVADDAVIVITETAEAPDEIDENRAHAALERADRELRELPSDRTEARQFAAEARARAIARLELAKLKKTAPPPM